MRLAAALLVLASHAFVLTGWADAEPIGILTRHSIDGGGLAVAVFFVVSGFLVTGSVQRRGAWAYLRARALRIYPAFLLAVVLQTLILGVLATSLPWRAYLADPAVWGALLRAPVFGVPAGLPGVFTSNPVAGVVNGSLWTLRIEALCYLLLLALAAAGLLRRGWVLLPLTAAWLLLLATMAARAGALPGLVPGGLGGPRVVSVVDCGLHFMMGAACRVHGERVRWRWWGAAAGVALFAAAAGTAMAPAALHLALPAVVLWLGLTVRAPRPSRDISYGAYLYAFPVEQAVVAAWPAIGPWALIGAAMVPTLMLAWMSWRVVERPALRLKGGL